MPVAVPRSPATDRWRPDCRDLPVTVSGPHRLPASAIRARLRVLALVGLIGGVTLGACPDSRAQDRGGLPDIEEQPIGSLTKPAPAHTAPEPEGDALPNPDRAGIVIMTNDQGRVAGVWITGRRGRAAVQPACMAALDALRGRPVPDDISQTCPGMPIREVVRVAVAAASGSAAGLDSGASGGAGRPSIADEQLAVAIDDNGRFTGDWRAGRTRRFRVTPNCIKVLYRNRGKFLPADVGAFCGPVIYVARVESPDPAALRPPEARPVAAALPAKPASQRQPRPASPAPPVAKPPVDGPTLAEAPASGGAPRDDLPEPEPSRDAPPDSTLPDGASARSGEARSPGRAAASAKVASPGTGSVPNGVSEGPSPSPDGAAGEPARARSADDDQTASRETVPSAATNEAPAVAPGPAESSDRGTGPVKSAAQSGRSDSAMAPSTDDDGSSSRQQTAALPPATGSDNVATRGGVEPAASVSPKATDIATAIGTPPKASEKPTADDRSIDAGDTMDGAPDSAGPEDGQSRVAADQQDVVPIGGRIARSEDGMPIVFSIDMASGSIDRVDASLPDEVGTSDDRSRSDRAGTAADRPGSEARTAAVAADGDRPDPANEAVQAPNAKPAQVAPRPPPTPSLPKPVGKVSLVLITDQQGRFTGTWFTDGAELSIVPPGCLRALEDMTGSPVASTIGNRCGEVRLFRLGTIASEAATPPIPVGDGNGLQPDDTVPRSEPPQP